MSDTTRGSGRISRRALLGGAVGVAALAALGVGAKVAFDQADPSGRGRLVTALLASHPFYCAHRGGSLDWPEMSLSAYRHSVNAGANALEISLARSSDGVWFGLHDETLDRTSGTQGFVASQHTWSEISRLRISPAATTHPHQASEPYLRFEDLASEFAASHTIFVDPKSVNHGFYPELLKLMKTSARSPVDSFIAKFYCTGTDWAAAARAEGYRSWGYYYGSELDADPSLLDRTEAYWDILGIDYSASIGAWKAVLARDKIVIAHIIATESEAKASLNRGAHGLMVSGITEVLT